MEKLISILKCDWMSDCAKYVCNSCTFDSECSECCEIHFVTTEVDITESEDETEIEVTNCCLFRHKE